MNALTAIAVDRSHDSILRLPEVLRRTGLSTATIYRREVLGTFPARVRLGPNCVGWYQSEIDRWVAEPMAYQRS